MIFTRRRFLAGSASIAGTTVVVAKNSFSGRPLAPVVADATVPAGSGAAISHLQPFSLTGSDFGAKTGGLRLDDHGQAGAEVVDSQWFNYGIKKPANPAYLPFAMKNRVTTFNPTGANVGPPHPFVGAIAAGAHCGDPALDIPWSVNLRYRFATLPNPPFVIYARWFERQDPNWVFIHASDAVPNRNLKMFAYMNCTASDQPVWYLGWVSMNPGPMTNKEDHILTQILDNDTGHPQTQENPDRAGHSGSFYDHMLSPNSPQNGWILREVELCVDTATGPRGKGFYNYLQNSTTAKYKYNPVAASYAGRTDNFGGGFTDGSIQRGLAFGAGFYDGDYGTNGSGAENNWSYLADLRIDVSAGGVSGNLARVIFGDAPTYAASKIRSYCNISSWTGSKIDGTFWQDKFVTGQSAYAHVITESGTVLNNVAQYTVTQGQIPAAPGNPTVK